MKIFRYVNLDFLSSPIIYIVALIAAGIVQLKANIWTNGIISIVIAMTGFAIHTHSRPFTSQISGSHGESLSGSKEENAAKTRMSYIPWAVIIALLSISVYASTGNRSRDIEILGAYTWIVSLAIGLITVFRNNHHTNIAGSLTKTIRGHSTEIITISIILIIGFALRVIHLNDHPYPWSGDEASIGIESFLILGGQKTSLFDTGWSIESNWAFVPNAVFIKLFGPSIISIRLTSVIAGTLAILFTYLAARELFNKVVGVLSAAFLAVLPYHIHFSRLGVHNIIDSIASALAIWLISRALRTRDLFTFYLAGAIGGLCIYTYAGTKLVPALLLLYFFISISTQTFPHGSRRLFFTWLLIGMAISAIPQFTRLMLDRNIMLGRFNQENIFLNGWLYNQIHTTGVSPNIILYGQFAITVLTFIVFPAYGYFYNSPNPYLTTISGIFFLLGMSYIISNIRKPNSLILLFWFWIVVILGGVFTLNPPANTRLLMTTPAIAMFFGIGVYQTTESLKASPAFSSIKTILITTAILSVMFYQNISFYMKEYREGYYFQDYNSELAMESGLFIRHKCSDCQVFIIGGPNFFSTFPTLTFLNPHTLISDLTIDTLPTLNLAHKNRYIFISTPENKEILGMVMDKYLGGKFGSMHRTTSQNGVLFEYYIFTYK